MQGKLGKIAAITAFVVFAVSGALASGLGDIWSNLTFGISSHPEENGNVSEAYIRYPFTDLISSQVKFLSKTSSVAAPFDIDDSRLTRSLNLATTSSNEFFIYPFELSIRLSREFFSWLSGGFYVSAQGMTEVGFFKLLSSVFSYDNDLATLFYGPLLDAAFSLDLDFFRVYCEAGFVPIYFFTTTQTVSMDPLVTGAGTLDYSASSFPYVFVQVKPDLKLSKLFGVDISGDVKYEYYHCAGKTSEPNSSGIGWTSIEQILDAHTLTALGNISIPLPNEGNAKIGAGKRYVWNLYKGSYILKEALVFNLEFDIGK